MAISNYTELKSAITNWGKRPDDGDYIDDFIDLCEADIWESLRIREMQDRATGTLPAGVGLTLPSDFLESRKLRLTTDPSTELTFRVPEAMSTLSGTGKPTEYTITDRIEFDKDPNGAYTYELTYYKSLTALSASNTTNAVLTKYPSIYLYGSLKHYFDWAMDEEKAIEYESKFLAAVLKANRSDKKGRYPSGKSMKREGPTP